MENYELKIILFSYLSFFVFFAFAISGKKNSLSFFRPIGKTSLYYGISKPNRDLRPRTGDRSSDGKKCNRVMTVRPGWHPVIGDPPPVSSFAFRLAAVASSTVISSVVGQRHRFLLFLCCRFDIPTVSLSLSLSRNFLRWMSMHYPTRYHHKFHRVAAYKHLWIFSPMHRFLCQFLSTRVTLFNVDLI